MTTTILHTCSASDHPAHRDDFQAFYQATHKVKTLFGSESEQVIIELCDICYDVVIAKLGLEELTKVVQCQGTCQKWFVEATSPLLECELCPDCCHHASCESCNQHDPETICQHCNDCEECCECRICSRCDRLAESSGCEYCERHCECNHCPDCGTTSTTISICGDCNSCLENCCGCEHDDEDRYIKEGRPWLASSPKFRKSFSCSRLVGVEWEVNSCQFDPIEAWTNKWRGGWHTDASCGWEAITPPIAGDYIAQCLSDLGAAFNRGDADANDQCGIHVHVDASDYRWEDMYRLLAVYTLVEPVLFILAGQERITNHYCRPCGQDYRRGLMSADRKNGVLEVAYSADSERVYGHYVRQPDGSSLMVTNTNGREYCRQHPPRKKDGGRYRALNICPWLYARKLKKPDCTVEFRMHSNSLDTKRIIQWTQLLARLVDWSAKATDKEVADLPQSGLRALSIIAPDSKDYLLSRIKDWRSDYLRFARRICVVEGRYEIR